jgi:tetratricopeptide (TPR) repeat protein
MFARLLILCAGVLFATAASVAAATAPAGFATVSPPGTASVPWPDGWQAGSPVQVRVEKVSYLVRPAPAESSGQKTNPNLAGKASYTTDAIILENEYVKAVVLPEFGARLPRVTFKGPGGPSRDLFQVSDALQDAPPWSMGGMEFSFPYCEYGRHMDEGAGWRIVTSGDGSVTVAMDMRFSQYAGEVQRYGRFSSLRQAVSVTLRPGTSALEYVSRIDNRLPVRHGFRLWSVASLPREAGAHVLMPAAAVTDNGATALRTWPTWDDTDHGILDSWSTSSFAVDKQGDWAGVYYPGADANHLVLAPRYTAMGTRLYVPGNASDKKIEIWNGSNPLFEHPGHFLQPLGTYVMPLRLAMVTGIGRIDWVGDAVAVSYEPGKTGARIRIASFQVLPNCTVMARTKAETVRIMGTIRPNQPLELQLEKRAEPVLLTVVQGEDAELAEVSLPWRPQPAAPDTFKALQREVRPWGPLSMELSDWPHDREANLGDAAKALTEGLTPAKPDTVLQAAAVVLRTEAPGSPRWQAVRGFLDGLTSRNAKNPHAEALLGMMLLAETGGRPSSESGRRLAKAEKLPGAAYLLALDAIAAKNTVRANALLRKAGEAAPIIAMGDGSDALPGGDRLHPAALAGGEWPAMLRAALALEQNQPATAKVLMEQLLAFDPARPEALALLAEAFQKLQQTDKAMTARTDAERLFQRNEQARRDYEALLREARDGVWSGIPRP